jgi:hypothetical protein
MKLQPNNFEICHCTSEKHVNADMMLRLLVVWDTDSACVVVEPWVKWDVVVCGWEFVQ